MPNLNWLGKDKVVTYHQKVPYHFLDKKFSVGNSDNKIIHGDNLIALKSLLPRYENKINCIYIDPPYNTGNENWIYNDNVSDSRLQKWLGQVVGKEGEDLTRHDKWLCMMYPRLRLLQKLLADDGAIFISIDDNEQANLKLICDEIFGAWNFICNVIWQKRFSRSNDAKYFCDNHDYIFVYAKDKNKWRPNLLPRAEEIPKGYKNPDNDPRGVWTSVSLVANGERANGYYEIIGPTGKIFNVPKGHHWSFSQENFQKMLADNRIWFGADGNGVPRRKTFLSEVQQGLVPFTIWLRDEVGDTQESKREVKSLEINFDFPKPTRLIERILKLASDKNSIVLDSFAGSGTTAHAVINLNKQDGGNRKFILIELNDYAENITAERVKRVGGSFDFYEIGESLFDEDDFINEAVPFERICEYIYYSETRKNYQPCEEKNLLGVDDDTAYYYFGGEDLSWTTLAKIKTRAKVYVIYADSCHLSEDEMQKYNIHFRQISFDVRKY